MNEHPYCLWERFNLPKRWGKIEKNKNIPSNQDEVKVSTDGQVFQRLLESTGPSRHQEDKVKMFQEQISRGEFNLDSESIAESLLSKNTEDK